MLYCLTNTKSWPEWCHIHHYRKLPFLCSLCFPYSIVIPKFKATVDPSCIPDIIFLVICAEGPNVWLWPLQGDEGQEDGKCNRHKSFRQVSLMPVDQHNNMSLILTVQYKQMRRNWFDLEQLYISLPYLPCCNNETHVYSSSLLIFFKQFLSFSLYSRYFPFLKLNQL